MYKVFKNRTTSNGEQIDELLSAYLDGVLALEERKILENRLRREPALVARLEGLRKTKKALASLPKVGVPRNFILVPSMVAPPRPATPLHQRRTWPVFGWATAAVTVLFLLVFAGDVFLATPSGPQPTHIVTQQPKTVVRATVEVESPAAALAAAPAQPEAPAEVTAEEKTTPAIEAPRGLSEQESPTEAAVEEETEVAAEVPEPAVEADVAATNAAQQKAASAESTTAGGGEGTRATDEAMLQAAAPVTEELQTGFAQETSQVPSTATPGVEGTPSAAAVLPTPEAGAMAKEMPPAASPAGRGGRDTGEPATAAESRAIVPLMVTPATAGTAQAGDHVRFWLRLAEFGLGIAVVGLAVATLVLRQRES
jgi:anti-sigma factor RsiW